MNDNVDPFRDWDSAYVLGALGSDDRRAFERHLATCPACAAAVAELAGLPGILGRLTADEAVAVDSAVRDERLRDGMHDPGRLQRLAASVRRRRRRVRAGLLGAGLGLAAILVVGGIVAGTGMQPTGTSIAGSTGHASRNALAMEQVQPGVMTAELTVSTKAWGTRLDWNCSYLAQGPWGQGDGSASYDLVITDRSGRQTTVATWTASGPGATGLAASTSVRASDIRSVDIRRTGSDTALVRTML
ncbi:MAG TPA: zf-HC2 domain-containing protein [Lacisediminihabitans sp.]|uniref:zf-HC2 domain-containing protein n=1 Tax=Lacisediminihabitans sp. TaxID=2787631 RepID=UPI002EDB5BD1